MRAKEAKELALKTDNGLLQTIYAKIKFEAGRGQFCLVFHLNCDFNAANIIELLRENGYKVTHHTEYYESKANVLEINWE